MNYLAHIYLSGENTDIQIGNFMGDAVKGRKYENYALNLKKGILLHRQIDTFTDQHPIVRKSKQRLHPRYHHYKGVLIDIFYDHFLSKNWNDYSSIDLELYIQDFYKLLDAKKTFLPEKVQWIVPRLIESNWFGNYDTVEGMARVLNGMENRINFKAPLSKGTEDLIENYKEFENDFQEFFPLIQTFSKEKLEDLNKQFL